ncbi:MAG: DUF374 domain-containing protein [Rickettsiales bacterium]|nr:DUF374 domain-containing protein [Rickettsiales bacterium]
MKIVRKFIYKKLIKKIIVGFINFYILLVYYTSSKKIEKNSEIDQVLAKKGKYIFVFWHGRLALLTKYISTLNLDVNSLISSHSDGDIVEGVVSFFKSKSIRGSSSKNASTALRKCLKTLAKDGTILTIAVDGPRGPRMRINSEIVAIAEKTGAYIIPITYSCKKAHFWDSWDRFLIPIIYNEITYKFGAIYKPKKGDDKKKLNQEIENDMNNILWALDNKYNHDKIEQG